MSRPSFFSFLWLLATEFLSTTSALPSSSQATSSPPTATLTGTPKSTIFIGRHIPEFAQDVFLGIKYANKPIRFTQSTLKNNYHSNDGDSDPYPSRSESSGSVYYNATQYGNDCPGYGSDENELVEERLVKLDEDCLNLNIIRPAGKDGELLPVMIWIFGGGWQQGATADPRYNMSYIVQQGAENGKTVLGVSINYRLAAFGFLDSKEVRRNAMRWVKKNIKAFGGDPEKITIWGESAGAYSVGAHLVANDGDNGGLFRAAIMESGNAVGPPYNGTDWYQPMYDEIVNLTGCSNSTDTLQCLREVPFESLYKVAYQGLEWFAVVDGTFIKQYPQISYAEGKIAKIPILLGANTDEGTSFGTTGTDTDEECIEQLIASKRWVLTRDQAIKLLSYYPDDPAFGCPYGWGNVTWPNLGLMYKRYESMAGDITMVGPRRLLAETIGKYEKHVYSYRWDVAALNTSSTIGVQHFAEIPFIFANPIQDITPLGSDPARLELGRMAARMWTSFVTDLDPNGHSVSHIPTWPKYTESPANFVFRLPKNDSYIEKDTFRTAGIEYINSIPR